jgi:hypothetical protein
MTVCSFCHVNGGAWITHHQANRNRRVSGVGVNVRCVCRSTGADDVNQLLSKSDSGSALGGTGTDGEEGVCWVGLDGRAKGDSDVEAEAEADGAAVTGLWVEYVAVRLALTDGARL